MKITKKQFFEMVGSKPVDDDLERCNCKEAGQFGHWACGICKKCNKPRFICGHTETQRKINMPNQKTTKPISKIEYTGWILLPRDRKLKGIINKKSSANLCYSRKLLVSCGGYDTKNYKPTKVKVIEL